MAELERSVQLFASGIVLVERRSPVATNLRRGTSYQPGIGPFGEDASVSMVMNEIGAHFANGYQSCCVPYPSDPRKKCDLCFGKASEWELALESKAAEGMGDNGKTNDSILMHILSPYPSESKCAHRLQEAPGIGFRLSEGHRHIRLRLRRLANGVSHLGLRASGRRVVGDSRDVGG